MKSDNFVNTGFTLFTAHEEFGKTHVRKEQRVATNAKSDLFFNYTKEITLKDIKSSSG